MILKIRIQKLCLISFLFFFGCGSLTYQKGVPVLKSISLIDRNGTTETFSNTERLKQYDGVDFLKTQPYAKILRVYNRDARGNIQAYVTSYHPNGQPKQYLEILNSRAFGCYKEWHENGKLKLTGNVIGGEPDIDASSEETWLFDDHAFAWDEEGNLIVDILYEKGKLQGNSHYYHPNGNLWKRVPYSNNVIDGTEEIFLYDGSLLQNASYSQGLKHGLTLRYWAPDRLAAEESYSQDILEAGKYYDFDGNLVAEVVKGTGHRATFGKKTITELHEYHQGVPEGEVKVFGSDGKLMRVYHVKNGQKHGEEIDYYDISHLRHLPKLSVSWYEGKIQGVVKSWYDNGAQESKREMSNNEKNGLSTAWYRDGNLMLLEEYDHDKLVKGEYYRRGDRSPMSLIKDGEGIATIFDPEGSFVHKIKYSDGTPMGVE